MSLTKLPFGGPGRFFVAMIWPDPGHRSFFGAFRKYVLILFCKLYLNLNDVRTEAQRLGKI